MPSVTPSRLGGLSGIKLWQIRAGFGLFFGVFGGGRVPSADRGGREVRFLPHFSPRVVYFPLNVGNAKRGLKMGFKGLKMSWRALLG